jgi:cytochrome c oxidase subunit 1
MVVLASMILGGVDTGWTFYAPFSTTYSNTHVATMAVGIILAGLSSVLTGLNFIVTIHQCRAPGLSWPRLPLFIWAIYCSSVIFILGAPVLATSLILVIVERVFRVGVFDPALGGNPLLFQRLFWFYSLPAIYIMVLPAMGVVSEIIPCFSRKRISGYRALAASSVTIAALGVLIWGHHLFLSEQSIYGGLLFSIFSLLVTIPLVVNVFHWTATLYQGRIYLRTPMLYALGSIGLFTIGGLSGLFLATLGVSAHLEDTYFFIAHFHYVLVGGAAMGYLAAIHFWWPKITGRLYPEFWGKVAAVIIFIGFNLTFLPQFILGYLGMPRRFYHYPPEFQVLNVFSTAFASIMGVGYILPLVYLIWSLRYGQASGPNPWSATGLEWQTASPPPKGNFSEVPTVKEEAYAYEKIAEAPVA